jgi:hypothetical protein
LEQRPPPEGDATKSPPSAPGRHPRSPAPRLGDGGPSCCRGSRRVGARLGFADDADSDLAPGLERLAGRSQANAPIIEELRAAERRGALSHSVIELAPSYVHMSVNRMIRSAQRNHELVLYDLLVRLYESRLARARQQAPLGAGS